MAKIKKFTQVEKLNPKAVFRNLPGFKLDEGVWVSELSTNKEFRLPQKSDLDLSSIPREYYKSGIVGDDHLEFEEINFQDERTLKKWIPGVKVGQYYSFNTEYNLHSTTSTLLLVKDDIDSNDRSILNLNQHPHQSLPITAEYLKRNAVTQSIESAQRFTRVSKFKGIARNGKEYNGDIASNTDTSVFQFKIEKQDSEPILNQRILPSHFNEIETDIYEVTSVVSPVMWWKVKFSRPDIFKNELSFDEFLGKQVDPVTNGNLTEGDYCIGYGDTWNEGLPLRVYLETTHVDYGTVSYKPLHDSKVIFNKDVRIEKTQTFANSSNDTTFFLTHFPVLDLSIFRNGPLGGPLEIDGTSITVETTDDEVMWTRVDDIDDEDEGETVYDLDPLYGVIRFKESPSGPIEVNYTQVPLVQYDILKNRMIFDDDREDLDPQVNALKRGFLVLDNRRLVPYRMRLTANGNHNVRSDGTCCYGPIDIPASDVDDLITLKARVVARGNPEIGVPNIPVKFISLDGLVSFSQEHSVTDGDGYAYTEALGISNFSEFVVADYMYEPMDADVVNYLNPDPADGDLLSELPPWGAHLSASDTLVVGERFTGDVEDVYLLIQSIPADGNNILDYDGDPMPADEYLEPYNGKTRSGGVTVVWSRTVDGAEEVLHPTEASAHAGNPAWTEFTFPIDIPTGQLIVGYKLVIDRSARVKAVTIEDPLLESSELELCIRLNSEMKGQWKLPNLLVPDYDSFTTNPPVVPNTDSSRISSAVYMSPNDFVVTEIQPSGGGDPIVQADVGTGIDIIGTSFPTTDELHVSVYIVKANEDGEILAVKNITSSAEFVDATTIRIASLPTPPTEEYDVNYWIAVGGFHPEDPSTGARRTATILEIGEES